MAALDQDGVQVLSRRIANSPEGFRAILHALGPEAKIALEATYGWDWLAELVEDEGHELHLAHPLAPRAVASARVKPDAVDTRTLAHLLQTDLLPEACVAPRELRDFRELLRHRIVLTRMRTTLKNRVHAILARHGVIPEHSDLFGVGGRRFLAELALRPLMGLIVDFDREIAAATPRSASGPRRTRAWPCSARSEASAPKRPC